MFESDDIEHENEFISVDNLSVWKVLGGILLIIALVLLYMSVPYPF